MSVAVSRSLLFALAVVAVAGPTFAGDGVVKVPLAEVLAMPEAKSRLDGSVSFYLAGMTPPHVEKKFWEATVGEKTNAFNKTSDVSCRWVALSALIELQQQAKRAGANAVVDIVSYHRRQKASDPANLDCHDGVFTSGVALKGTLVDVSP